MKVSWSHKAWEDYTHWQQRDPKKLNRINRLIKDAMRDPRSGSGKPEKLKNDLRGCWSRRIDKEHRLVHVLLSEEIHIIACRYHYK